MSLLKKIVLDLAVENPSAFNPRLALVLILILTMCITLHALGGFSASLIPYDEDWDSPQALHTPMSDDIPWARQPEHKITIEDVKYALSGHYQGTAYDPYARTVPKLRADSSVTLVLTATAICALFKSVHMLLKHRALFSGLLMVQIHLMYACLFYEY